MRRTPSCASDEGLWVSSIVEKENGRVWTAGVGGPSGVLLLIGAALATASFAGLSEI